MPAWQATGVLSKAGSSVWPLVLSLVFIVWILQNLLEWGLLVGAKMFHRCCFSRAYRPRVYLLGTVAGWGLLVEELYSLLLGKAALGLSFTPLTACLVFCFCLLVCVVVAWFWVCLVFFWCFFLFSFLFVFWFFLVISFLCLDSNSTEFQLPLTISFTCLGNWYLEAVVCDFFFNPYWSLKYNPVVLQNHSLFCKSIFSMV